MRISAGRFLFSPTTLSENDGQACFSLRSSSSANTGCSAKMCSGRSNFKSTPVSTARESTPEIRIPAIEQARIINSRLFPVLTDARIRIAIDSEVHHALACEAVINLVDHPTQTGAAREIWNDRDCDPGGEHEREDGSNGGQQDAALLCDGCGKKRDCQRRGKDQHGHAEISPAGFVAPAPHAKDE